MALMVYFFLSSEEVVFNDSQAFHFTVEFQAWDHEMMSFSSIIEAFHPPKPQGGGVPHSLNDQFRRRFLIR